MKNCPEESSHMKDHGTHHRNYRWLKIIGIVIVLAGVSFYVMHLTGHMPFMDMTNMSNMN